MLNSVGLFPWLLTWTPYPVKNPDGTWGVSSYATQEVVNPIAYLSTLNLNYNENKLVGNIWGELEIIKGLKAKPA
jgi:hypothetical protein